MNIGLKNMNSCKFENLLNGQITYQLPYFQREYSWTKDEWSELVDDIKKSLETGEEHFLGFMTFIENEDVITIIEGQQRLSTVTIIICLVRDMLYSYNDNTYDGIDREFIRVVDPLFPSREKFLKLKLSGKNEEYFRTTIQRLDYPDHKIEDYKQKEKKINRSNKLIFNAYKYFHDSLKELSQGQKDRNEFLRSFLSALLRKFIVARTYVTDEIAAYIIFQTLNNRGLDLALSDLLKVYLLNNTKGKLDVAKSIWEQIKENLSFVNANSFFRHYWLSKYGVVKEADLLNEVRKKFNKESSTFEFLDNLKIEAETYEALLKPTTDFWNNHGIVELLDELLILTNQSALPLLLAIMRHFESEEEKKNCIKIIINYIFRYLNIAEWENKRLERLFSDSAIEIRNGEIKYSDQLRAKLKKEYVGDDTFIDLFKNKEIKKSLMAKYILEKIEKNLEPDKEKFSNKITLEHILPINPDEQWLKYLKEEKLEKEDAVHRLGNMTLVLGNVNKKLQNKIYHEKFSDLSKTSTLRINEYFKNKRTWNLADINERQEMLAMEANKIWYI